MKRLITFFVMTSFALLVGCGENDANQSPMQDAKKHMSDAAGNIKEAGKDVKTAFQPTIETIKKKTNDTVDAADKQVEKMKQKGRNILKDTKQKTKELVAPN